MAHLLDEKHDFSKEPTIGSIPAYGPSTIDFHSIILCDLEYVMIRPNN